MSDTRRYLIHRNVTGQIPCCKFYLVPNRGPKLASVGAIEKSAVDQDHGWVPIYIPA
jgi:hypothetical protein